MENSQLLEMIRIAAYENDQRKLARLLLEKNITYRDFQKQIRISALESEFKRQERIREFERKKNPANSP